MSRGRSRGGSAREGVEGGGDGFGEGSKWRDARVRDGSGRERERQRRASAEHGCASSPCRTGGQADSPGYERLDKTSAQHDEVEALWIDPLPHAAAATATAPMAKM